jgi:predicted AlkP superfamily phosphohydrolase/phosphomutase
MDFSEGLTHIEDNTIELISIDGHHSYESVSRDFKNALPKINKNRGVVLFHDVNEYQEGFGVSRFWMELKKDYEHFEFFHGHGLGVLFIGKDFPHDIESLVNTKKDENYEDFVQNYFQLLGQRVSMKSRIINLIKSNTEERKNLIHNLDEHRREVASKNLELINLYQSRSFRVTSFLRRIGRIVRRIKICFK